MVAHGSADTHTTMGWFFISGEDAHAGKCVMYRCTCTLLLQAA